MNANSNSLELRAAHSELQRLQLHRVLLMIRLDATTKLVELHQQRVAELEAGNAAKPAKKTKGKRP